MIECMHSMHETYVHARVTRFCYVGPRGSWTPLHRDVLHSFSWSCNLSGRKLWIMYPPEEDAALRNNRGDLPWDVTGKVNDKEFPLMETARPLVVTQHPATAAGASPFHLICSSIQHNTRPRRN